MKKLTAVILIFMVLLSSFSLAEAEEQPEILFSGKWGYTILEDGTAEIRDYRGVEREEDIPDILDGMKVTSIGDEALYNSSPDFVTIPYGVTRIGNKAFSGGFKSITIPDSVTSIGDEAFCGCDIESITIPDSVTSIGDHVFFLCDALESITIPDNLTSIGYNPFGRCNALKNIVVSPDHPTLAVMDGVLYSKPDKRLVCYPLTLTENTFEIPQGIRVIGEWAFDCCVSLTSVIIPDSVTSIEYGAFNFCELLNRITIPDSVRSIGEWAFANCVCLSSVTIPDGVTSIGNGTLYNCLSLTSVSIPDSVTSIGRDAFNGCKSLQQITIPDGVTEIGEDAFQDCEALTITVSRDSYAARYCKENGLNYTYPDSDDWLKD